jgi:predicted transcriptional regulator
MAGHRTPYEIYWEILVYCRSPRSFTAIINRCDLNSRTGQEYIAFLISREYLAAEADGDRTAYRATPRAAEYITLFSSLYQELFDTAPGFRL